MMGRKRIAYLNSGFFDTDITVVKELQKVYDVVWFVALGPTEPFKAEFFYKFTKNSGIDLRLIEFDCRRRSLKYAKLLFRMVNEIRMVKPVLIYTCISDLYFYIAYLMQVHNIPIILGVHDVEAHSNHNAPWVLRMSKEISIKLAKQVVLFSKNQYDLFKKLYPLKPSAHVGMSCKNFGQPTIASKSSGNIRLLFFGTLQSYKGTDLLIQAFDELIGEGVMNLQLSIYGKAGSEEYRHKCMSLITHPEYYNLHLEFVANEDIPNIFAAHDFSVFPYRDATQSGPLMINVFYGLPIIAPAHTCFSDIYTNEKDSLLYSDSLSMDDIKGALRHLSQMSDKEIVLMREKASSLCTIYSENNIAQNYIKVFTEIEKNATN